VIGRAAEEAGIDEEKLVQRLQRSQDRAELLLRSLRAAEDAGHLDRLVAIALSLAAVAMDDEDKNLHWEKALVGVLGALDGPHFELLRRFTLSGYENNLQGEPSLEDQPTSVLNDVQLELALPGWQEILPTLIAALQSHGLVRARQSGGGGFGGGGGRPTHWEISAFGEAVLARLGQLGDVLNENGR